MGIGKQFTTAGRRGKVSLLGVATAGMLGAGVLSAGGPAVATTAGIGPAAGSALPVAAMERILQAKGQVSGGLLNVEITRTDISATGGHPQVPFKDGFQLQHGLVFEPLDGGKAIFNGDVALKPSEIQPVISAILAHGLVFQAEHQHLYDISPMVWFVHFRGVGDPLQLAREVHAVIATTSTPLPQQPPAHPTTPLPAKRLGRILGGPATVGENGVVTVDVPRTDRITLAGIHIDPDLNIANNIQFEPLAGGKVAAVPDFAMTAGEVGPVIKTMQGFGWEIGCLYNQETAENPQLYFSHTFKTGDPIALARQIRAALDRTKAARAA